MKLVFDEPAQYHVHQLAEEIRAAVGEKPRSRFGSGSGKIELIFERELSAQALTNVAATVAAHNGAKRNAAQAAETAAREAARPAKQARRAVLLKRLVGGQDLSLAEVNELLRLERGG